VANVIVNPLIFVVLLSPVVFPISQLPLWLADLHRVLPIYYLAQVIRATVTTGPVHDLALSYAVLAAWTAAAWAGAWVISRRRNGQGPHGSEPGRSYPKRWTFVPGRRAAS
jgi:ABC-2 type transport system permease protein